MAGAVTMTDRQWLPIAEIAKQVNAGSLKAVDLVEQSLRTITEQSEYQAIIATLDEAARARAQTIDAQIAEGKPAGRLAGVPFIAKDNYLVFGADTTAASNILRGFRAPYQSTVINRLEAEGAICVAKANLDAFAHGGSTENSDFFTTKNPHDPTRVPGGSSGGSAASRYPRYGALCPWYRYRWLNPPARQLHWRGRLQADIWYDLALWRGGYGQ